MQLLGKLAKITEGIYKQFLKKYLKDSQEIFLKVPQEILKIILVEISAGIREKKFSMNYWEIPWKNF